ncbi:MAG: adenylate/guanylate cyclase domain-containing protein [Patescibacteria group bacterium]
MKKISTASKLYLITQFLGVLILLIAQTPYFVTLNNLFTDLLQGQIQTHKEIVIVGIDDASLKQLGAWPWDRELFATAIQNLQQANPNVIGIDVLFLEPRKGDDNLKQVVNNGSTQVVLANKFVSGEIQDTVIQSKNVSTGYVNVVPDIDGKIRNTTFAVEANSNNKLTNTEYSFAMQILSEYYKASPSVANSFISLRKLSTPLISKFSYSNEPFATYSFTDIYNNNFNKEDFNNKIVLIGITTNDVKNNVADNFVDVFGDFIAGVQIHANIINSFLQERFLYESPLSLQIILTVMISFISTFLGLRYIKTTFKRSIVFAISLVANLVIGIATFETGLIWPFILTTLVIITNFVGLVAYDAFINRIENRFIRKAFTHYVNPGLLSVLIKNPKELHLGGQEKRITVMFLDIRNFTSLAEKYRPDKAYRILNTYLEALTEIVLENDGTIDKYLGDGLMAIWNAPVDVKNHEYKALKTALEVLGAMEKLNKKSKHNLNVGIGINTAEMLVGNVGGISRFDYTVVGDGANVASRIEGLTKVYGSKILTTNHTIKGLQTDLPNAIYRKLDKVAVKGKSQAVWIYDLLPDTLKNHQLKEEYEHALDIYREGNFKKALPIFEKLVETYNDHAAKSMVQRLKDTKGIAPENWDGNWMFDHK